jgi:hypothetical protein
MAENQTSEQSGQGRDIGSVAKPQADAGERTLFSLASLAALVILAVIAWPMANGLMYTYDDLGGLHIPARFFFSRSLAEGHSYLWNPYVHCGYYQLGEGQVGMYHPLHRLLYGSLPFTAAFNAEFFLSYPFMLAGMYLFLRRWQVRRDAAMFGALAFTFSGFNLLHFMHMHVIAIVAHIPWLLLSIDVAIRSESRRRAAGAYLAVLILTASQLLLGHAQFVWFTVLVEILYVILLRPYWRGAGRLAMLATAGAIGVLVAGVQLVPTYDVWTHSDRWGVPGFRNDGLSLPPVDLVQLVAPYLLKGRVVTDEASANTHEYGLYGGAFVLAMFLWLVVSFRRAGEHRRLAAGAIILTVLALALALGRYGGFYTLAAQLPVVGWFRAPCRYIVLVNLGMAVGAALAFDAMARTPHEGPGRTWWGGRLLYLLPAVSIAALILSGWPFGAADSKWAILAPRADGRSMLALAGPVLVTAAVTAVLAAARGARWALAGLILFAAADQAIYGISYMYSKPPEDLVTLAESVRLPTADTFFRIEVFPTYDSTATLKEYHLVTGYVGLTPKKALDYTKTAPLRLASTLYKVVKEDAPSEVGKAPAGTFRLPMVANPMPRVRFVTKAVITGDAAALVDDTDIDTTALVGEELRLDGGAPGAAYVTDDLPGQIAISADTPSRQLLILSERYDAGWRARIDEQPARVIAVYGDFIGVVVEPGHHSVELAFRPESLKRGIRVSLVGLALTLVFALFEFSRKGRPASG